MPNGELRNRQDCEDFICGCLFLGTGGGGSGIGGLKMLLDALDRGLKISWVDISEIPDDAWTCTIYSVGSIAPLSSETKARITQFNLTNVLGDRGMEIAVRELSEYSGRNIQAIVPVELGAGNSPGPLIAGIEMGIPVVDGDYAGRAVPEEMQSTPYLFEVDSFPLVSVDLWGNIVIFKKACNPNMLERITKMLSVASFGKCTVAATLIDGEKMKNIVVPGTLTKCLEIGRTIRFARENAKDPAREAAKFLGGWFLFEGTVTGKDWEDLDGTMTGTIHIQGSGDFEEKTIDIWFKNENHVSWLNGHPYVCSPDLIVIVDKESGEGITNDKIVQGQHVAIIGIKGLEAFRSERGLKAGGPRYFGFDIDYVAIEELMELNNHL
jgi:uncharacterized protein